MKLETIKVNTKPCPFCGGRDIHLYHTWFEELDTREYHTFTAKCGTCSASAETRATMEGAVSAWERRTGHDQD